MSIEDENASKVLANIQRSERDLVDLYQKHSSGAVGYQHFYLFGITRRALAQSLAFRQMIADRNSLVALSIVRMQLDTVLRLYALFWAADPEEFATRVYKGTPINRLKAANGHPLSDTYLKERVADGTIGYQPSIRKQADMSIFRIGIFKLRSNLSIEIPAKCNFKSARVMWRNRFRTMAKH